MSAIPPPKGAGGGLKPPASKIGLAKPGGLKAGLLAKGGVGVKSGAETPAPPSRQQSSVDLSAAKGGQSAFTAPRGRCSTQS